METSWSPGLPWTGEQVIPELMAGDARELQAHTARYVFALRYCTEQATRPDVPPTKIVLDAACGAGFGTAMLSWVANKAYGIDLSEEVIQYAANIYKTPRVEFHVGDALYLDALFELEFFDTIVSFETIEHVGDPVGLLESFHWALKPGGTLVVSAPHGSTSLFHVPRAGQLYGNYTRDELWKLLAGTFPWELMEYWCQDDRTNFYRDIEIKQCPIRTHIVVARKQ